MTKLLYVCLDGLGDDPIPELDGRTPLEAAPTPNLDELAARGRTGTVVTVGPGIAPESDIGVFGILGYDPHEEHPGRGVLEAIGIGMDFRDGDLAYRINFATCEWPEIVDRRVGRNLTSDEAHALAAEVNERLTLPGATFDLRATVEHRGALVIRADDGQLSAAVTNTDPAYKREGHLGVALESFEPVVV
ncbi:MAG: alkaline phosphatase family protein, partial [Actinomycetota bacterium]